MVANTPNMKIPPPTNVSAARKVIDLAIDNLSYTEILTLAEALRNAQTNVLLAGFSVSNPEKSSVGSKIP